MNKSFISCLLIVTICILLPGCGATGNSRKLRKMAAEYIQEKYNFDAKALRVSNDGINWDNPIWVRNTSGIVEMEYKGELFYVYADMDQDVDACTDSYMENDFCDRIASYFKDIRCDEMNIVVSYTEGNYPHLVGKDILSFDDLIADERILGIFVDIYTYGLDTYFLSMKDLSDMPWLSTVRVHDWVDSSFIESGYEPVTAPTVDELIHVCYAEYNADPETYQAYFEKYQKGKFTIKLFEQMLQDQLNISCEQAAELAVSDYQGCPESDYPGVTEWIQMTNSGSRTDGIIAFPGDIIDFDTKVGYIESYDGKETSVSLMANNKYLDFGREYYFAHYTLDKGETMIFRMVAEDK